MPAHLALSSSQSPPVGVRSGCCHSDRLRIGTFLYANVGASSRTGTQGSLSLLRGSLYPSCFSFQPPLCFEVVAFDGGRRWMVAVEYLPLALLLQNDAGEPELAEEQTQTERAEQQPSRPAEAFTATAQQQRQRRPSGDQQGGWEQQEDVPLTAAEWQQQQVQRLAAVQQLHSIAAAPLAGGTAGRPAALVPGGAGLRGRPASLLLSSAQLAAVHPEVRSLPSRLLALHSLGLPAFRAALSVHLNGLAAAPADASPQHVAQMAAAQRAHAVVAAARPPLCTEQLLAAFGPGWLDDWQEQLRASSLQGLPATQRHPSSRARVQPPAQHDGTQAAGRRRAAAAAGAAAGGGEEFVYIDPSQMLRRARGDQKRER
ncbi:hypothetical protein D9Q98_010187 [Chlorella vulgaris]|uniref:Uncharacterized protein n=1 Tax=Chlorella vulgaris TaxID=3077 RepID=A0A9D4YWF5_CHLVU|nr:hypothetical protein D9Q98_010187 [Chlorella vulgaris]